ncbi:alpha/beta fold hydrolase [Actinomycetospora flava]|uniref:Alpha/beta fold hydrolase n=1 Tax=Actinomycetospora flava TaxID=3129232 RepID=A0ABU8M4Z2_9PSEU
MTAEQQPEGRTQDEPRGPLPALAGLAGVPAHSAAEAWGNVRDWVTRGHLADTRRMPRLPIHLGDGYTVHRYEPTAPVDPDLAPLLLVPPLGAPDFAFDLRRGASLVEDLLGTDREIFIVTYDATGRAAGRRGLELWVDEIVPAALYAIADRHGDTPVHLAGWSLGGLFTLLAAASKVSGAPIRSVTAFASPVDVSAVPLVAPFRSVAEYTGGRVFSAAYRTLGSFPATAVKWAFQLTSVERYLTKPVTLATHLDDRELLEQIEAVDLLMDNMTAYPGRAFGQIYHHVVRSNDLAQDELRLAGRPVRLADVDVPVLLIAGADDVIAPVASVERATELLTASPDLRFVVRPGGHLGVLAGRRARENSWRDLERFLAAHDGA